MALTDKDLIHLAKLARINLSKEELEAFSRQLDDILSYIDKLKTLDLSNVEPTTHALQIKNVFRNDLVKESLSQDEALKNAPRKEKNSFKVPKIIE
ncbi:MAG: Asp-tRNA(Asn)/Glu-tRNA(Gln) amidotransferase subunit GatC [Candidatus Omnitrophota bacterium]